MSEAEKRAKILIVEDEPDLATTCARLIERMGWASVVTGNGQEAIELIDRERPDLVLTDLRLPVLDGLAVLRHARRATQKIPVVLLTAYTSGASRRQALEEGAAVYLPKPFSAAQLRTAVEQALAQGARQPDGPARA